MENGFNIEEPPAFNPDRLSLSASKEKIKNLQDGEVLFLSHSMAVVCESGQKILFDPAPEGILVKNKKTSQSLDLYPLSEADAMSTNPDNKTGKLPTILKILKPVQRIITGVPRIEEKFSIFITDDGQPANVEAIAQALAPEITALSVSHLDPDHFNLEFLDESIRANPQLKILVPLGFKRVMANYYRIPGVDSPQDKRPPFPEKLMEHLKTLSPLPYHSHEKGISDFYHLNLHQTQLGNCQITSYETPHLTKEYNQAILVQKEATAPGILYIPDAALSPEILLLVQKLVSENKISKICISLAKFQPDPIYDLFSPEKSKQLRDTQEEHLSHSAYIVAALTAVSGDIPIFDTHQGSFFRSARDERYLEYRLPTTTDESNTAPWKTQFQQFINQLIHKPEFQQLPVITRDKDRLELGKGPAGTSTRKAFSQEIQHYLQEHRIPKSILNIIHMPGPNEVIPAN